MGDGGERRREEKRGEERPTGKDLQKGKTFCHSEVSTATPGHELSPFRKGGMFLLEDLGCVIEHISLGVQIDLDTE